MSFNYDNIVKDSDPIVREKSVTVPIPMHEEDKELLMDMLQYVRDSQDSELAEKQNLRPAVGIAAIQLGIPKKMLAVVVPKSVEEEHEGIVPRAARIKVKGFDLLRNEEIVISASGYLAIVLQHEMDHFNGTLFYDHINVTNPWQEIPDAKVIE